MTTQDKTTTHKGGYFTKPEEEDLEFLMQRWNMNQSQTLCRAVVETTIRLRAKEEQESAKS